MNWILLILLIVCAWKWFLWRIKAFALIHYMITKGCPEPSDKEIEQSIKEVSYKMTMDLLNRGK